MTPERAAMVEALAVADGQVLVGRPLTDDERWLILHTCRLMLTCMPDMVALIEVARAKVERGEPDTGCAGMAVVA